MDMLKFGNNAANDLYTQRCKESGFIPTALFTRATRCIYHRAPDLTVLMLQLLAADDEKV